MIRESWHWKEPLARDADMVERWAAKIAMIERRSALIERKVMIAAFAMRKLAESKKLSSVFNDRCVHVRTYKAKADRIDRISDSCDLERDYEMANPKETSFPVMKLLDQIIHSHVFFEAISEAGAVEGFIVSSDRDRVIGVVEVDLPDFLAIMRAAADDYPTRIVIVRDQRSGKVMSWRGNDEMPKHVKASFDAAHGDNDGAGPATPT